MKKNLEEIQLCKQIKKTFLTMFPWTTRSPDTPNFLKLKNPIPVEVGTSFVLNSVSGRCMMTVLDGPTMITGVNPTMNEVVFNKKLTRTVRGKPFYEWEGYCFKDNNVPLSTLPLQILRFIASEFCN